ARCGTDLDAADRFCPRCGSALDPASSGTPTYLSRASLLRCEMAILFVGLVLLFCAVFGVWYALFYRGSPATVVRGFMDADRDARYADEQSYVLNRWDSQAVFSAFQAARTQVGRTPFGS